MTITRKTNYVEERDLRRGKRNIRKKKRQEGTVKEGGNPPRGSATCPSACWALSFLGAPCPEDGTCLLPIAPQGSTLLPPHSPIRLCLPWPLLPILSPGTCPLAPALFWVSPTSADNALAWILEKHLRAPASPPEHAPPFLP